MTKRLRLKTWLEPVQTSEDRSLLLSETTTYSLTGEVLAAMLPLLDGSRSEDDIADALSERFDLPEIYYRIIQLEKKGLIETRPEQEPSSRAVFYERLGGNPGKLDSPGSIRVTADIANQNNDHSRSKTIYYSGNRVHRTGGVVCCQKESTKNSSSSKNMKQGIGISGGIHHVKQTGCDRYAQQIR